MVEPVPSSTVVCGMSELCYYCGCMADTVDHVVPRHLLASAGAIGLDLSKVMRIRLWTVAACRECNILIGGAVFRTLPERVAYLKTKLRKRYAKWLNLPRWTEREIAELGPSAQADVRAALRVQESARERIAWRPARCAADISDLYELYRGIADAHANRTPTGDDG